MPDETPQAVEWALMQEYYGEPTTKENASAMVDLVRIYFNDNGIVYGTFSYLELEPLLS